MTIHEREHFISFRLGYFWQYQYKIYMCGSYVNWTITGKSSIKVVVSFEPKVKWIANNHFSSSPYHTWNPASQFRPITWPMLKTLAKRCPGILVLFSRRFSFFHFTPPPPGRRHDGAIGHLCRPTWDQNSPGWGPGGGEPYQWWWWGWIVRCSRSFTKQLSRRCCRE